MHNFKNILHINYCNYICGINFILDITYYFNRKHFFMFCNSVINYCLFEHILFSIKKKNTKHILSIQYYILFINMLYNLLLKYNRLWKT